MAYKHLLRVRRTVRLGGFGPLGGWYTVGPLSVVRCLQAIPLLGRWGTNLPTGENAIVGLVRSAGVAVFAPLVSVLVEEPVKRRHLARIKASQVVAVLSAAEECNDWPYILKAMTPGPNRSEVGVDVMVVGLAKTMTLDPRSLLTRPMQEVLAYSDALALLSSDQEAAQEMNDEDRELLAKAGMVC